MSWMYKPGIGHDLGLITKGDASAWATFSPDEKYRYALARIWDAHGALLVACCLNPSTATHEETDPTLSKWIHYARRDHYGGILLVNIAAWRATDPRELLRLVRVGLDPVGSHNQEVIRRALDRPLLGKAVAGWGAPKWKAIRPMIDRARSNGSSRAWHCLGVTQDGHPRHPLYLKNDAAIRPWTVEECLRSLRTPGERAKAKLMARGAA